MKHFGVFLANLRNDTWLSQEDLAPLVESSKSTPSRLENREHRQRPLQMLHARACSQVRSGIVEATHTLLISQ